MDIREILDDAQSRIQRIGNQQMEMLDTQICAVAQRMALAHKRIDFTDKSIRLLDESFGHGQEHTIYLPAAFAAGVIGDGALCCIFPDELGTLPAHECRVLRFITPNIIVTPAIAARLFHSDEDTRAHLEELRKTMIDRIGDGIKGAVRNVYGTNEVLPFDYLGSLVSVGTPQIYVWRNIVGDLIGLRSEVYFGFNVLPDRGIVSDGNVEVSQLTPRSDDSTAT